MYIIENLDCASCAAKIEAADVVYMTSSLDAIPESIAIARNTQTAAWQNVVFASAVKAIVMVLDLRGPCCAY